MWRQGMMIIVESEPHPGYSLRIGAIALGGFCPPCDTVLDLGTPAGHCPPITQHLMSTSSVGVPLVSL